MNHEAETTVAHDISQLESTEWDQRRLHLWGANAAKPISELYPARTAEYLPVYANSTLCLSNIQIIQRIVQACLRCCLVRQS